MHVRNDEKSAVGHSGFLFYFLFVLHDLQRGLVAPRHSHLNASQTPGSGRAAAVHRTARKITVFLGDEPVEE